MSNINDLPNGYPYPAYIDVGGQPELLEKWDKIWERKYNEMIRAKTIPELQSELDEILNEYCNRIFFWPEIRWLQAKAFDFEAHSYEDSSIMRVSFAWEIDRNDFIAAFPKWSIEPQGWIWGAMTTAENKLDARLRIEGDKVIGEAFEIKTGKPLNGNR